MRADFPACGRESLQALQRQRSLRSEQIEPREHRSDKRVPLQYRERLFEHRLVSVVEGDGDHPAVMRAEHCLDEGGPAVSPGDEKSELLIELCCRDERA